MIAPRTSPSRHARSVTARAGLSGLVLCACVGLAAAVQPGGTTPVTPLSGNQPDLAQPQITPALAEAAWAAQRWADAANAYRVLARENPTNGEYHFRLAYALHADGQYRRAIAAHQAAAEFDEYRPVALYNLGCAHAVLGNADAAFEALHEAVAAGFDDRAQMEGDEDLFPLHDDARWTDLLEGRGPGGGPIGSPALDDVDFLLGEWEVLDERGRRLGAMSVHPEHEDRAVVRQWRGDDGSTGTALLYWDEFREAWRQVGIDSDGNAIEGTARANRFALEFDGEVHNARGERVMQQSTIEQRSDGNLLQVTRESTDEGRTWRTVREVTYRMLGIVPPARPTPRPEPTPGRPGGRPIGGKPPKAR